MRSSRVGLCFRAIVRCGRRASVNEPAAAPASRRGYLTRHRGGARGPLSGHARADQPSRITSSLISVMSSIA